MAGMGTLSDRIGRRKVLAAVTLGGAVAGAWLAWLSPGQDALLLSLGVALWGAMAFPLYSIAVACANDYAEPRDHVMVSSGLLLVYGIGATIGPFVASAVMGKEGAGVLFAGFAIVHFLTAVFVMLRKIWPARVAKHPIAFTDALALAQTASQVYDESLEELETAAAAGSGSLRPDEDGAR